MLGAGTLAQLHKHIGDHIDVNTGAKAPVRLTIVGTATMPAIGGSGSGSLHMEMGSGVLFPYQDIPASLRDVVGNKPTGPNAISYGFAAA